MTSLLLSNFDVGQLMKLVWLIGGVKYLSHWSGIAFWKKKWKIAIISSFLVQYFWNSANTKILATYLTQQIFWTFFSLWPRQWPQRGQKWTWPNLTKSRLKRFLIMCRLTWSQSQSTQAITQFHQTNTLHPAWDTRVRDTRVTS